MLSDPRVLRCLGLGMHACVGSVDASGRPLSSEAIGVRVEGETRVTLFLAAAGNAATLENVARSGRIAIVSCLARDHATVQLKGRVRGVRPALESERPELDAFVEQVAVVLDAIGLPKDVTRRMNRWPAYALDVEVEAVFDQTPGPRAGAPFAAA
jgi:hypothetical protein